MDNEILTKEQQDTGLIIQEPDDHTLYIFDQKNMVRAATFYVPSATKERIRQAANDYLVECAYEKSKETGGFSK